jgi:hypothetical protein
MALPDSRAVSRLDLNLLVQFLEIVNSGSIPGRSGCACRH